MDARTSFFEGSARSSDVLQLLDSVTDGRGTSSEPLYIFPLFSLKVYRTQMKIYTSLALGNSRARQGTLRLVVQGAFVCNKFGLQLSNGSSCIYEMRHVSSLIARSS